MLATMVLGYCGPAQECDKWEWKLGNLLQSVFIYCWKELESIMSFTLLLQHFQNTTISSMKSTASVCCLKLKMLLTDQRQNTWSCGHFLKSFSHCQLLYSYCCLSCLTVMIAWSGWMLFAVMALWCHKQGQILVILNAAVVKSSALNEMPKDMSFIHYPEGIYTITLPTLYLLLAISFSWIELSCEMHNITPLAVGFMLYVEQIENDSLSCKE